MPTYGHMEYIFNSASFVNPGGSWESVFDGRGPTDLKTSVSIIVATLAPVHNFYARELRPST